MKKILTVLMLGVMLTLAACSSGKSNRELDYVNSMAGLQADLTGILLRGGEISGKLATNEITYEQGIELLNIQLEKVKENYDRFKSIQPPNKFEVSHKHIDDSYQLTIEGYEIYIEGTREENATRILEAADKFNEATSEMNTAYLMLKEL